MKRTRMIRQAVDQFVNASRQTFIKALSDSCGVIFQAWENVVNYILVLLSIANYF